jgi:hypothetical protein
MDTQHFDHWFTTATKGLATEESKLLRLELESHYQDALQSHLGSGLSQADAAAKAVASLGNAKQCNRAYHQLYFTESEYKGLFTPAQQNPAPLSFIIGITSVALVIFTIELVYSIMTGGSPNLGRFLMILTFFLILASLYLIAVRCPSLCWPGQNQAGAAAPQAVPQAVPQPLPLASISPPEIAALRTSRILLLLSSITMVFMVVNWSWSFAGAIFGPLYYLFFCPVLVMFIPTIRKLSRFGNDGRRAV